MTIRKLLLAAAVFTATTGMALAQAPAGGGRMAACRDDMQKFCADKTGPDRRACMEGNKDKLSDGCKAARAARISAPSGQ
jgi:hypothetical protein